MWEFRTLVLVLIITTGCETVWKVPPATGRVIDSRSQQPIADASVTRIAMSGATVETTTGADGRFGFRGKRSLQIFPFGDIVAAATYRIEALGYETIQTNRHGYGSVNGLRHNFGEIQMSPE